MRFLYMLQVDGLRVFGFGLALLAAGALSLQISVKLVTLDI